jgi:uncharacterized repeat protein (TIGR04052 family)
MQSLTRWGSAMLAASMMIVGTAEIARAAPVTIRFKAQVGRQDFACGRTYFGLGSTNTSARPQDFRFFVQDLKLIRSDSVEVPVQLDVRAPWQLQHVALIDFENATSDCAGEGTPETNTIITGSVPDGSYTGISFTNGIPEDLNHDDPVTSPAPLSAYPALSWGWLSGYRFFKAELLPLPAGDNRALAHVGSTSCSGSPSAGTVTCARPNRNRVVLRNFNPRSGTVVADLAAVFAGTALNADQQCHSTPANLCTPMFSALGVNFGTGQALATQSVFTAVPVPLYATLMAAAGMLGVGIRRRRR